MTCDINRDRLDAYVANTLAPAARAECDHHLASCAECREDLAAAQALAAPVAALPRTIEPERDLWPMVRARLVPPARRGYERSRWIGLAAAAAIVLMAGSSAVTLLVVRHAPSGPETSPVAIEAGYVDASAALLHSLDAERDKLSPETVATLQRNLAVIDAAIAESRAALASDPRNQNLAALLWASYRQKVALLQQVSRLVERS